MTRTWWTARRCWGFWREAGYTIVEEEEAEADAIVINTCCFIHDAKEESIETIIEMASWKEKGRVRALVITGCLAERYKEEIGEELPEVDAVIGTTGYTEIVKVLDSLLGRRTQRKCQKKMYRQTRLTEPVRRRHIL